MQAGGKQGLTLTDTGKIPYKRAQQMLELADGTREDVSNYESELSESLVIGCVGGRAPFLLARWIRGFREEFPLVAYTLRNGSTDEIMDQLIHHLIDLAVVATPYNQELLEGFPVSTQPWIAMIPSSHPLAKTQRPSIRLAQLAGEPLIIPERQSRVQAIERWFESQGVSPMIVCRTSSFVNAVALVEEGTGICIFPQATCTPNPHVVIKLITDPPKKLEYVILDYTEKLGMGIGIIGLYNIQFIVDAKEDVYVIEVNPRSSRTVPFLSKSSGYSLADIGTLAMLGVSLRDQGLPLREQDVSSKEQDVSSKEQGVSSKEQGVSCKYPADNPRYHVKVPAFSFSKLAGMDAYLSPEMKSTGEAIGYDRKLHRAAYKAFIAAGNVLPHYGTVLVSVADEDKAETIPLVRRFYDMGFNIEATTLTGEVLRSAGIPVKILGKPSEGSEEVLDAIRSGYVSYVINTRAILSGIHYGDGVMIRACAAMHRITMLTSLDTVKLVLEVLEEIIIPVSTI